MQKRKITIGIDASRAFVADPAGPEYYSWHIIKGLASPRYKSHNFVLYVRPGQKADYVLPHNIRLKEVGMRYLWTQVWLAIELIIHPVDILFIPAHTLPLLCKVFLPHMPIVVTIHGLEGKFLPQSGNFLAHIHRNWSITWAVRLATKLIAVSRDTASDIVKTYHINTNKIEVIHEGVDLNLYKNSNHKNYYKTRKYQPYILFVGTLQPRKNLVRLIRAFSLLKDKKIRLLLAGKYGWLYQSIIKAPQKYKVADRVIITGRVDQKALVGLYKGAKAFILPSITEGFGLPILEAQAAGIPIIASNGGALPEIAGKGAIFVNPLKIESIKRGLEQVLTDKKLRTKLIKEGNLNVAQFSWEKAAHNTLTFLLQNVK